MNEELESEILSYRAFKNRETLLAWQRRRQAYESQAGRRSERRTEEFVHLTRNVRRDSFIARDR